MQYENEIILKLLFSLSLLYKLLRRAARTKSGFLCRSALLTAGEVREEDYSKLEAGSIQRSCRFTLAF